ncbi:TPA: hypothetical protein JDC18_003788 [Salmonella enterica subsp. houtenae]|nr:hypothetical protein [Salmonella enterica]HBC0148826.1 hypothetical protein [Salmonella enterica subsp. houtenae]
MIFGSSIMVDDKGGLTPEDSVQQDSDHPDYEYRMASLSMSSSDVVAVTSCGVARHKFDVEPLKRGDYTHHIEMFEKSISLSRYIKASIDMDSVSDRIYCITNKDGKMVAVSPSTIQVSIREIIDDETQNIYCGEFYFDDENEKREYSFKQGDNSLSISLNLNSESFSQIFERLSSGDDFIDLSIHFPAYASWLDSMAGVWPTTYIIKPKRDDENFAVLTRISSSKSPSENHAKSDSEPDEIDIFSDDDDKVELKDIDTSIKSIGDSLSTHLSVGKQMVTYLTVISICLVLLTIKVFI